MQPNNHGTASNDAGKKKVTFKRVDNFDVTDQPPDAPEGPFVAHIEDVKVDADKDGWPRIIPQWKFDAVDEKAGGDSDAQGSGIGATVATFHSFMGQGSDVRKANFQKSQLLAMLNALSLDESHLPKSISRAEDLDELVELLKTQSSEGITVWNQHRKNNKTGATQCNILFEAPKGSGEIAVPGDAEEEAPKANTKGKPAAKPVAKRR